MKLIIKNEQGTLRRFKSSKRKKQEKDMTIRQTVLQVIKESSSESRATEASRMSRVMGFARLVALALAFLFRPFIKSFTRILSHGLTEPLRL